MTSLTGGNAADKDIRKLMEQIIAERDAKFAPKKEGGQAAPTGGMFDKPEVKANDGDVITDLLGYLEQKRTEALDSYQSKVMRRSSKPLPKPEDIDVSSFLSEAGLSSQPEPLTFTSDTAPALGEPSWSQVADNIFLDPSKEPAKPTLSEELLLREGKPVEELTDDEKFLRTGELPKEGLMSPVPPVKSLRPKARPVNISDDLIAPKAPGYKDSQIVSHSYYNDDLVSEGARGKSRRGGDASRAVQASAVNAIIKAGRDKGMTDRQIAMTLAIARHESGFNPDAAAGTTSAHGLGQFINNTGKAYGITDSNRWDLTTQAEALVDHTLDNYALVKRKGKDEAHVYKYHHDGPVEEYGGLSIAQDKVLPYVDKFLTVVRDAN